MPPRSNLFQDVVAIIHRHIGGDSAVTESAMLLDRSTGDRREVDVVITSTVAGQEVVVCVEAANGSRKEGAPWVEQQVAKHRTLPTAKLVLVSGTGFTGPALRKAESEKVETITPEDLASDDAEFAVISKLSLPLTVEFTVHGITFDVRLPPGGGVIIGEGVYLANGCAVVLDDLVDEITERALRSLIDRNADLDGAFETTCAVHISPIGIAVDGNKQRVYAHVEAAHTREHVLVPIDGLTAHIGLAVQSHPSMSLVAQRFDKTDVLYGETQLSGAKVIFVATETGGEVSATVRTREPGEAQPVDWELIKTIDIELSD